MAHRGSETSPTWESVPRDLTDEAARSQEYSFRKRAAEPILWAAVPWADPTALASVGRGAEWLRAQEAAYYAETDREELILIRRTFHGWPDPPEWGLMICLSGEDSGGPWLHLGSFDRLPPAWRFEPGHPD